MTDSFNIYNKKGNNVSSSRRQAKHKGSVTAIGLNESNNKKIPNTTRNESSKSTPSSALIKGAKSSAVHSKNIQSTGSMMKSQGILRDGSDRYLPLSS